MLIPGAGATVTDAVDGALVTAGPDGGLPVTVAESSAPPWSTSACVTGYVAVQVVDSPAASVVTGQVTGDRPPWLAGGSCASSTVMPCSASLPVLVTRKL